MRKDLTTSGSWKKVACPIFILYVMSAEFWPRGVFDIANIIFHFKNHVKKLRKMHFLSLACRSTLNEGFPNIGLITKLTQLIRNALTFETYFFGFRIPLKTQERENDDEASSLFLR